MDSPQVLCFYQKVPPHPSHRVHNINHIEQGEHSFSVSSPLQELILSSFHVENQSTSTSSPATTSSVTPASVSRRTSPSLWHFWLLVDIYIYLLFFGVSTVMNEHISVWKTLFAILLVQPFLFLCANSRKISAAVVKRAFQKRIHVARYWNAPAQHYTLRPYLSLLSSSADYQ